MRLNKAAASTLFVIAGILGSAGSALADITVDNNFYWSDSHTVTTADIVSTEWTKADGTIHVLDTIEGYTKDGLYKNVVTEVKESYWSGSDSTVNAHSETTTNTTADGVKVTVSY